MVMVSFLWAWEAEVGLFLRVRGQGRGMEECVSCALWKGGKAVVNRKGGDF